MSAPRPAVAEWLGKLQTVLPGLELRHLARPERLSTEVRSVLRGWAEESLHFFTVMVLGYDLLGGSGSFHWRMCEWLEDAARPQLLLCYRGGYKSTVGTIAYPLWRAAKDPEHYSHLEIVADKNLGLQMMDNLRGRVDRHGRMLLAVFPEMAPANTGTRKQWTKDAASLACRTDDGPTWSMRTMGQGRAGRHVSTVGMDDIVNEINYSSQTEQDALKRQLDFLWPTLEGNVVIAKGTFYQPDDFWHYMVKQLWPLDLDVQLQPVRGSASLSADAEVVLDDDGVYAHPAVWDDERLEAVARKINDPVVYYSQYFLDSSLAGGTVIHGDWLHHVGFGELPALTYYLAADPASGKGPSKPAVVVVGIDERRRLYLVHADDNFDSEAGFLDGLFALQRQFLPRLVSIEAYGQGGKSVQQQVLAKCRDENHHFPVEYVTHGHEAKEDHIRRNLQAQYQWGNVYHLVTMRNGPFEQQLLAFPNGKLLDMLDAAAYAVRQALRYGSIGPPEEAQNRVPDRGHLGRFEKAYSLETLLTRPDLLDEEHEEVAGNARVW